jgi:TolB-like protein/Tfp pilus assembly protein PilF/predicted Ser/Thr protein kinase
VKEFPAVQLETINQPENAMMNASRVCAECEATVFADSPQGLCSVCLFRTGLALLDDKDDKAFEPTVARMLKDFGDYEVLEEIGHGGQGVVYRARQKSLNRTVALKVIGLAHWATEAHVKRFRLEAEAAASLNHPCIVPIYEVGEREGACYFSMGLVKGGQLDAVAKREPIPIRHAAELIAKLARTVSYAHEHGILHRDIKPGNILLDEKGKPHLTDFGLARLVETESTVTRTMEVLGTPSYMAPEQAVGNNAGVTSATDIYGLGAVLYQLLTGHPPFAGGTTYETVRLVLDAEPRQPRLLNTKVDRDLNTICLKCLEKDPKRRYFSALALAEDLERWLKHEPIRARRTGLVTRGRKWVRRNPSIAVMAAMLLVLAVPLGVMIWKTESERSTLSNPAPPEKSIAVLPFSNLSKEQENAFFADGVQDEILSDLAKVADLKVISRTSVMPYKSGIARNLRQIGQQLGVAHVVEGSVQRSGNRVRVNAQLVDARTDRHLWGQTYDRNLADVFTIQSEIAKTIADQLQAKLSPREENAIQRSSTSDISAFDLYARAKNILLTEGSIGKAEKLQAVDLLNRAVARDPSFFDAYCQLAFAHDALYFFGEDHTSARLALAEAALQAASRLRPDAGETHLARGQNLYWAYGDYDGALAELEVARQTLPNDARILGLTGLIQRRQGRWEESTRNLERAVELNPRDSEMLVLGVAGNYWSCRRYAEAKPWAARVLTFEPNNSFTKVFLAYVDSDWNADTRPLHQTIDSIRATNPAAVSSIAHFWLVCALAERDAAAAKDASMAFGDEPISFAPDNFRFNRPLAEGVIARMTKDDEKARSAFTAARAEQEKVVQAQPNYAAALCVLGLIDAGLGRKEEALREGRRAVQLLPVEKDSMNGMAMVKYFAMIAAWVGEKDLACEQLASVIRRPSSPSYGQLKLLPFWDPLRGDPRFEKIVEEAKRPVAIETTTSIAPEESIAVLPFENLSDDKEHAFFADGVQDDILTKLAKVADLKVISRTSVMQYRGKQNAREIGAALRVSHVLEGSVRSDGARIHLNAQLIDTRTDTHVWAEEYDRDVSDMFAIQSEIAKTVADQLQAKISVGEKAAIEERPTKDFVAYDLYVRATSLLDQAANIKEEESDKQQKKDYFQAVELLNQAISRDPAFLLAYCNLADAHDELYFNWCDHTPSRLDLAQSAINAAFRLKPDSGEAHLALAAHFYHGYYDYDRARDELAIAARTLPNNARIFEWSGYIDRRQSRWHDAVRNFERANELDPRNERFLTAAAVTCYVMRNYKKARENLDRLIALEPRNIGLRLFRAWTDFNERADTEPLHAATENMLRDDPASARNVAVHRFYLALYERDPVAANRALATLGEDTFTPNRWIAGVQFSPPYAEGLVARMKGDAAAAQAAFTVARAKQEEAVRAHPDEAISLCVLGLIDAALGRKEEALREGHRAVELLPVAKDSFEGADVLYFYAVICGWTGERDLAIEQLETLAKIPSDVSYGDLRLEPNWDPLRGDPRFEKIVGSLAPKEMVSK